MADTEKSETLAEAMALGYLGESHPTPLAYSSNLKGAVVNSDDPPLHGQQPEPDE